MVNAMQPIFITGGSGFVGHGVKHQCQAHGFEVISLQRTNSSEATVWHFSEKQSDEHVLIHCAARAHQGGNIAEFRRDNTQASLRLAEDAYRHGMQRMVYVSSIGVCGRVRPGEIVDGTTQASPSDPYAVAKYEAELGLQELADKHGFELVIARPTIVYGNGAPGEIGCGF